MSDWTSIDVGEVGVDTGCLMVIDPCYVIADSPLWSKFLSKADNKDGDFDKRGGGLMEFEGGIVFRTAHGDGSYTVEFHRDSLDRIVEVRILLDS